MMLIRDELPLPGPRKGEQIDTAAVMFRRQLEADVVQMGRNLEEMEIRLTRWQDRFMRCVDRFAHHGSSGDSFFARPRTTTTRAVDWFPDSCPKLKSHITASQVGSSPFGEGRRENKRAE